jgi:hypothetical protein
MGVTGGLPSLGHEMPHLVRAGPGPAVDQREKRAGLVAVRKRSIRVRCWTCWSESAGPGAASVPAGRGGSIGGGPSNNGNRA